MKQYRFLDNNHSYEELIHGIGDEICMLIKKDAGNFLFAWGIEKEFEFREEEGSLTAFFDKLDEEKTYKFGFLTYDLKNRIEPKLESKNPDQINFPEAWFFEPRHLIINKGGTSTYFGESENIEEVLNKPEVKKEFQAVKELTSSMSRKEYLQNVSAIQAHIQRGDIYEMNYCINFHHRAEIHPEETFLRLDRMADAPFSAFANLKSHAIISASPERFLKKKGKKIISQPIKGTSKRGKTQEEDEQLLKELENNSKERSENIMIVDLVRNDLSRIAQPNSVKVESLCEPHRFKTVHQLISAVSCQIKDGVKTADIINATFPMGSMTGAPKFSAMEIAEKHETFKRGLYSGSLGYMEPNGDMDFNVVIRTILYQKDKKQISCSVGGAITIKSDPNSEYEECILKLEALKRSLC